jgi:hypothetical protein
MADNATTAKPGLHAAHPVTRTPITAAGPTPAAGRPPRWRHDHHRCCGRIRRRAIDPAMPPKFRRYDAFLTSWWRHTRFGDAEEPPFVLFICQDQHQREHFMAAADRELKGHHWHPSVPPERHEYTGRRQMLFALERDMHAGSHDAWRLPVFPPDHPHRTPDVRYARLPAPDRPDSPTQLRSRRATRSSLAESVTPPEAPIPARRHHAKAEDAPTPTRDVMIVVAEAAAKRPSQARAPSPAAVLRSRGRASEGFELWSVAT